MADVVITISSTEVEGALRNVPLLFKREIFPYREAHITWRDFDPCELWPAGRYVVRGILQRTRGVDELLCGAGINLFDLSGGIRYTTPGGGAYVMYPPIVEESPEDGNRIIICDGRRRVYLARQMKKKIRCLFIQGISAGYPLPGLPNPKGWEDIEEVEEAPAYQKRKLFRTFASQDGGSGDIGMETRRDLSVLGIGGGKPR